MLFHKLSSFAILVSFLVVCLPANAENMIDVKAEFGYMVDYDTDEVLFSKNAETQMGPSSMTKLMTAYLVFQALEDGRISMDTKLPVSEKAWRKGGSKMFVKEGDDVAVEDLIQGMIVQSGNDACIVLAEGLSGSEANFAEDMNVIAKQIGLEKSHFKNATGWPDEGHVMTTKDLVTLARRLYEDFPQHMHFYSQTEYEYGGIKQYNRNKLLHKEGLGVDGFKTGYTSANGYGITVTAAQDGRRVFVAINGADSPKARLAEAEKLVRHAFRDYRQEQLFSAGDVVEQAPVWLGQTKTVPLVVANDISFLRVNRMTNPDKYDVKVSYTGPFVAPVQKGEQVGQLTLYRNDEVYLQSPLLAGDSVSEQGFFDKVLSRMSYYFMGE